MFNAVIYSTECMGRHRQCIDTTRRYTEFGGTSLGLTTTSFASILPANYRCLIDFTNSLIILHLVIVGRVSCVSDETCASCNYAYMWGAVV